MSNKVHGKAIIRRNGTFVDTFPNATLTPGGTKNTSRASNTRSYYSQTYLGSKIVCEVPVTANVSLTELQSLADVEITFESDVGRTYICKNCAQTGDLELSGGDDGGKVELTFEGDAAEEMSN